MKKFILAAACLFTLGTSLSAQCPAKTDSVKKEVAAKSGATKQAHSAQCCSGKTKECDCKEGAACSTPEGAKICAAHHAAAAQDSVKSCCKAESKHGKCGEKACAKDNATATQESSKSCCKADGKQVNSEKKSCCKRDAVAPQDSTMSCCKADSKQAKMEKKACCKRDAKKSQKKSCCQ